MGFHWSRTDSDIGAGFVRIAREQIAKAIDGARNEKETSERRVHEARRRCKKLRALFLLVRPDFDAWRDENRFVRDCARGLSAARDIRVASSTFADLMRWAGRPVATAPREAGNAAGEAEALQRFVDRMHELQARTDTWKVGRISLDSLTSGLAHTYRRARRSRRLAEKHRTDEAFHEWRKYAKYHWNQLGLLEECAEDILPSAYKSAGDLGEVLGLHHDLAVLEAVIARSPADLHAEVDAGFLADAIERRRAELERRIASLGRQVFAERPEALKARFDAYLETWPAREAAE